MNLNAAAEFAHAFFHPEQTETPRRQFRSAESAATVRNGSGDPSIGVFQSDAHIASAGVPRCVRQSLLDDAENARAPRIGQGIDGRVDLRPDFEPVRAL